MDEEIRRLSVRKLMSKNKIGLLRGRVLFVQWVRVYHAHDKYFLFRGFRINRHKLEAYASACKHGNNKCPRMRIFRRGRGFVFKMMCFSLFPLKIFSAYRRRNSIGRKLPNFATDIISPSVAFGECIPFFASIMLSVTLMDDVSGLKHIPPNTVEKSSEK